MCIVQRGTNYWHKHQHIAVASMTEGVCKEKHIEKHLQQFLGGFLLCVVTIEAPGIRQAIALRGRLFSTVSSPHSLFTSHTSRSQSCNQETRGRWFWWTSLENLLFWSFSLLIMACHLSEASLSRLKNTHTHTDFPVFEIWKKTKRRTIIFSRSYCIPIIFEIKLFFQLFFQVSFLALWNAHSI